MMASVFDNDGQDSGDGENSDSQDIRGYHENGENGFRWSLGIVKPGCVSC